MWRLKPPFACNGAADEPDGGIITDRLEAFEKMLADMKKQAEYEQAEMERLKSAGREKSATYRQFFGNRLFYKTMFEKYRQYGLLE